MNVHKVFLLILCFSFFIINSSFGQSGTWTWLSGDSGVSSIGVFGTQGVPSVNNHPPGLYEPVEWKDKQGNFWIYGGTYPSLSDLWKYNPFTNEWTWVKGNGLPDVLAVYGLQGISDPSNTPGWRSYCAATWVDTSGALWLFGGGAGPGGFPYKNDLWKYDISTNMWTWISGSQAPDANGVHGTQGIPGHFNNPGARTEACSAWTDSLNNLWLFGGSGYDDKGIRGDLNDLCKYDISTNEWTWMKGSAYANVPANYGTEGVANTNNDPGARFSYTKWKDKQGNFWIMGGHILNALTNDVWEYNLSLNEWVWMSGTNVINDAGNYQSNCSFDTINLPYSRYEQRSSVTDNCGRFWLFGGFSPADVLNDLWLFDPQQLKWNWISGTNVLNQYGDYGTIGIASSSNIPPSRGGADAWWGNDNKFYMFGGFQLGANGYSDVWVFNPDTNCISVCAAAVVFPIANFQSSKTIICANDCINFTNQSTNATSWQWIFAGAMDSISTAQNPQNICYTAAGIFNVKLIASNAAGSDTVTFNNYIKVNAAPPTPVITQYHDTLICNTNPSYTSYQWSFDSTLLAGATDTFLIVSKSGDYNLQVTNSNDCKIAVGINIVLGIQNYADDNIISLSPNPATNKLYVSPARAESLSGKGMLKIYNALGEVCEQSEINSARAGQSEIDVSLLPSGIYFVQIVSEGGRWIGKFIKE